MIRSLSLLIALFLTYYYWDSWPVTHGPGVLAPDAPKIEKLSMPSPLSTQNYTLEPRFYVKGQLRILAVNNYWLGEKRHLSQTDFVASWEEMSDERYLNHIHINIWNRSYKINKSRPVLSGEEIDNKILFAHAIGASPIIESRLKNLRKGHIIEFEGYVVDVFAGKNLYWKSSYNYENIYLSEPQVLLIDELIVY